MTGKEEKPFKITYSKEAKEMIEKENLGRIIEIIEDDFVTKVCESIYLQQIDELTQCQRKLTKYERAFDIFKEVFDIRFEKDEDGDCWIKIFPKTYDDRHILGEPTNEQYELLEELMNNENS